MKSVYFFGQTRTDGDKQMKSLLGGKGANLAEMAKIGLPIPPGFTITTVACLEYLKENKFAENLWPEIEENLLFLEKETKKKFGDENNPLLLSVRSGAVASMPGMMDTVLNLGLNEKTVAGMIKLTDNPRFVWDAYRRLIQMFGDVVMQVDGEKFEQFLTSFKQQKCFQLDTELAAGDWSEVASQFKQIIKQETGEDFPQEPYLQLKMAIEAVFKSWHNKRAVDYRNFHGISHDLGTAVNIMAMVFGNTGEDSATGVVFTRDPADGTRELYGEYLLNAQGEDVVAGIRTPKKIVQLEQEMPVAHEALVKICDLLERHYQDVQDVEFTIENGKLWILQTRDGKRTPQAAVKIAVDLVKENLINQETALLRVAPEDLGKLLHPMIDPRAEVRVIAKGLNASPGAASGLVCFDADLVEEWVEDGKPVILVRPETDPDDVHGMIKANGILTQHGGATSHAAIVARGLGKPCVTGCETLEIDLAGQKFRVGEVEVKQGEQITINGNTGEVILGQASMIEPALTTDLNDLLSWANEIKRLGVWANADNPQDAQRALEYGAEGIGLCRTEHMFFGEDRRPLVQKMIMTGSEEERKAYLERLLPFQRKDFEGLFEVMADRPVIIRLIDPPMHEFLPAKDLLIKEVAQLGFENKIKELQEKEKILKVVENLWEINPMLGLRGCRAGIMFPEISAMQVRAIFEAACNISQKGIKVLPEVMIPLVADVNELKIERERLEKLAQKVMAEKGVNVDYKFGTMIELPRAALIADELGKVAQFFSFGTNDLTQTTFGISRDDAEGKFLLEYVKRGILKENPFQVLDQKGVGQLMKIAVEKGKQANPALEIGICGEHGGEPSSIEFAHQIGLKYVSCSPFRVPVARLAAAQAVLKERQ